jgi:hypothetical protein
MQTAETLGIRIRIGMLETLRCKNARMSGCRDAGICGMRVRDGMWEDAEKERNGSTLKARASHSGKGKVGRRVVGKGLRIRDSRNCKGARGYMSGNRRVVSYI